MINPISIALSGLAAASKKAEVASNNIVNADVVGATDPSSSNQAYTPRTTVSKSLSANGQGSGVQAVVLNRDPAFVPSFSPDSPFADANGLVNAPNVNLDEELVNMKVAENAYKANAQVIKTSAEMQDALRDALDSKH
ncbi:MAG: flagellar basal body rod C-terminal domain-containing protein [Pseudobdellovibrionaceae bacterium]|jgi:flagellar basal-body rod protein FlgC|nr:flagellar basal body rod C-terminal domain-containing protein [Pseudobdellovibrionaceae bacterium]